MSLTPLPTPPSRADSANFATRADAFFGALVTFQTEFNAAIATTVAGDQTVTGDAVFGSTSTNTVRIRAGSVTLPAFTTVGDTDTGIYFPAANTIGYAAGGVNQMTINTSGVALTLGATIGGVAIGYRGLPQNPQTASYDLTADDAGKHISITTGGVSVLTGVFSVGDAVTIFNNSATAQTITQGASTTLRQAGTTNTGNRSLAAYGIATVLCVASNVFVVAGNVS
jgi:hypothetical protein